MPLENIYNNPFSDYNANTMDSRKITQIVNTKATIFQKNFSRLFSPYLVHITLKLTFSQHANKACTMQT